MGSILGTSSRGAQAAPKSKPEFGEPLADVYESGAQWDLHKARGQSRVLVAALRETLGEAYAGEVIRCSTILTLMRRSDTGDMSVRPFESCRRRWCPVCSWRKSLRQWGLMMERLPPLVEQHGPVRWLLLTLTVRNCPLADLPATVSAMQKGFRRLSHPSTKLGRAWPATGWLKALEVTFPREGEAHPHYHVLMAVRPSYFKKGYIPQAEWAERWREAMRLDYCPVVDIRRVKPLSPAIAEALGSGVAEALGGLREVSKYVTKPTEASSPDALRGLLSLKSRRLIEGGGWLRGVLSAAQDEDDGGQEAQAEVQKVAQYWWLAAHQRYLRKL